LLDGRKRFRYNYASVRCKSLLGFCVGGAFANIAPECERDEVSGWKRLSHRRDRCGRERHIQAFIGSPRLALSRSRASNTRGAILGDYPSDEVQDMAQQIASGHASVHFGPFQNEEEVNRVHWRDFDTQAKRESEPTTISESIVWSPTASNSAHKTVSDLRMLAQVEKWMAIIREINREQPDRHRVDYAI